MLIYRLNRVPDKLHVALLELLGVELHGPTAARTQRALPRWRRRPSSATRDPGADHRGRDAPDRLGRIDRLPGRQRLHDPAAASRAAYVVERGGQYKTIAVADGRRQAAGPRPAPVRDAAAGRRRAVPRVRRGHLAPADPGRDRRLEWPAAPASIRRTHRCAGRSARPDGGWAEAEVLADHTGGFNYGAGYRRAPVSRRMRGSRRSAAAACAGCAAGSPTDTRAGLTRRDVHPSAGDLLDHRAECRRPGRRSSTPRGRSRRASAVSDGTPGQRLPAAFLAGLAADRRASCSRCANLGRTAGRQWTPVESFADSGPTDRHFKLDANSGEIELGPAVRQPDGGWTQYGAVPPQGAELRMSSLPPRRRAPGQRRRRHADRPAQRDPRRGLGDAIRSPAYGGVDPESLESARQRGAMEIRTRYRAVTAEDFEFLVARGVLARRSHDLRAADSAHRRRSGSTCFPGSLPPIASSPTRS